MGFEDITIERYTVSGVRVGVSVSGKSSTKVMRLSIGADVIEAFGIADNDHVKPRMGTRNDLGLLKLTKCSPKEGRRVFLKNNRAEITFSAKKWRIKESHETDQCSKWVVIDDGASLLVSLPGWLWSHLESGVKKGGE